MILGIIGSEKTFINLIFFEKILNEFCKIYGRPDYIVSGEDIIINRLSENWARKNNIPLIIFFSEFEKYGKLSRVMRNKKIVENSTNYITFFSNLDSEKNIEYF